MINRNEAHNLTKTQSDEKDILLQELKQAQFQVEINIKSAINKKEYETFINIPYNITLRDLFMNWLKSLGYKTFCSAEYHVGSDSYYKIIVDWR